MKLSDAIREEGYACRILKRPARVKGALGTGFPYMRARVYENKDGSFGVALSSDTWDCAYSASHEIAEHRWGFNHSTDMFCEQANLLARWIMSARRGK